MLFPDRWKNNQKLLFESAGQRVTYGEAFDWIENARRRSPRRGLQPRSFVLEAESTVPNHLKLLALLAEGHVVHLCPSFYFRSAEYRSALEQQTGTSFSYCANGESLHDCEAGRDDRMHSLLRAAAAAGAHPFIVRTSGSTSPHAKFVLHDAARFLAKYERVGNHFVKTLAFSPLDSIAGVETLLETVAHQNTLVVGGAPSPAATARVLREHGVDYFQTTPSFLSLMNLSRQWKSGEFAALRKIAYGSEPSQRTVLDQLRRDLPEVDLRHTYGMSEIGILLTRTDPEDPTRFLPDEALNPWRIRDELLEVRSSTQMLGYLNFPNEPLTDGWFATNDAASLAGGYLRVRGRADDILNVGGRKFYPSELESLLLRLENVADVTVFGQPNPLLGQAITAEITLAAPEEEASFLLRFRAFCESGLPPYMAPHSVKLAERPAEGARFKKIRRR